VPKFSVFNIHKTGIDSWSAGIDPALVVASLSTNTWNRFHSTSNYAYTFAALIQQDIKCP
jgi:hypothetical protein